MPVSDSGSLYRLENAASNRNAIEATTITTATTARTDPWHAQGEIVIGVQKLEREPPSLVGAEIAALVQSRNR